MIDNPAAIEWARVLVYRARLRLEIKGMRFSDGSMTTLQAVNKYFNTDFKRRDKALAFLEQLIEFGKMGS